MEMGVLERKAGRESDDHLVSVDGAAELLISLRNMAYMLNMLQRDPDILDPDRFTGTIFSLHCQVARVSEAIERMPGALPKT